MARTAIVLGVAPAKKPAKEQTATTTMLLCGRWPSRPNPFTAFRPSARSNRSSGHSKNKATTLTYAEIHAKLEADLDREGSRLRARDSPRDPQIAALAVAILATLAQLKDKEIAYLF